MVGFQRDGIEHTIDPGNGRTLGDQRGMNALVDALKERGVTNLRFVCLLAAPEGVAKFHAHHPEVGIWTASIDSHLNDHGYIVPGLGDAGDRMFGTK